MKRTITTISMCLLMPAIVLSMNNGAKAKRSTNRPKPLTGQQCIKVGADDKKQGEEGKNILSVPLLPLVATLLDKKDQHSFSESESSSSGDDFLEEAEQVLDGQPKKEVVFLREKVIGQQRAITKLMLTTKMQEEVLTALEQQLSSLHAAVEQMQQRPLIAIAIPSWHYPQLQQQTYSDLYKPYQPNNQ